MDLVHYSDGIPSTMHYSMLNDLSFVGVSQDLDVSQTGYITRKGSDYNFSAHNQGV